MEAGAAAYVTTAAGADEVEAAADEVVAAADEVEAAADEVELEDDLELETVELETAELEALAPEPAATLLCAKLVFGPYRSPFGFAADRKKHLPRVVVASSSLGSVIPLAS